MKLPRRTRWRRWRWMRRLHRDRSGATMLEWALIVAAIALPSYVIIRMGVAMLAAHYRMATTLNEMPFP